jgi:hypothetical protein
VNIDDSKITRVVFVDHYGGTLYSRSKIALALSVQDDGRTLKVFVRDQDDFGGVSLIERVRQYEKRDK